MLYGIVIRGWGLNILKAKYLVSQNCFAAGLTAGGGPFPCLFVFALPKWLHEATEIGRSYLRNIYVWHIAIDGGIVIFRDGGWELRTIPLIANASRSLAAWSSLKIHGLAVYENPRLPEIVLSRLKLIYGRRFDASFEFMAREGHSLCDIGSELPTQRVMRNNGITSTVVTFTFTSQYILLHINVFSLKVDSPFRRRGDLHCGYESGAPFISSEIHFLSEVPWYTRRALEKYLNLEGMG